MEFRAIIIAIIWRLAPALWLDWAIRRLIHWAIATLNDNQDWLSRHPRNCHWFGGWLTVIEARIEELINLRAHLLLNRRCEPRNVPSPYPAPAVRSLDDCLKRLARLVWRFEDVDRLALRRAETLKRLSDVTVIELIPDHRPTTTIFSLPPVDDDSDDSVFAAVAFCFHARGPPGFPADCPLPIASDATRLRSRPHVTHSKYAPLHAHYPEDTRLSLEFAAYRPARSVFLNCGHLPAQVVFSGCRGWRVVRGLSEDA